MNIFGTWEYYNSHFPKLKQENFDKLIYKAQRTVNKKIIKNNLTENEKTDVKDCICNVLNYLYIADSHIGKTGVSNDGYSESYESSDSVANSVSSIIYEWIGYLTTAYKGF